ncbi:NADH-quinone oxidoreductase subunit L [Entomomonas asaccharolytica]|uniref:NADH-quinone oxidoreductase subunit L n=1 Tax=Entomomonas asaccharolytica TaxID=2785331 RepID=A0A974RVN3_9GAMM|nr:NADH-quinone oxidoreductase subunit L [Entomomonas asaccharolytica]QQP84336.1 NADH-quinone oxidoreductase subunit L [Entomomonas asaccharolytica]
MNPVYLTVGFPLLGFLLLAFSRGRLSESASAAIGVGSIGLAALSAAWIAFNFINGNITEPHVPLWSWISVADPTNAENLLFNPKLSFYIDGLSVTMISVVSGVGFLIHLFASWYMRGEEGYSRFLAYMNLFVAFMLILVLGDDILFLYFGWEGVGLCSYLLIGFYYTEPKNGAAALKAFIITRIGDVLMAIGMFIILWKVPELLSLSVREMSQMATPENNLLLEKLADPYLTAATLFLFGGAIGKSAQVPLQTWLADAMAGPTPVSALIHAATMVTAGVYLLVRLNFLFLPATFTLEIVGIIGAITLLMAGFSALVQTDIKRILAYSTMSQLGYMFLATSVCAWNAAIFHLMTHAFFKALLFLASGSVILSCHHEQNIFKMGGLWKKLPLAYASFLVGGAALCALPFITAGFYSKDEILWEVMAADHPGLLIAGLVGAFMTSLYTFRLIFITFHGKPANEHAAHATAGTGLAHAIPLAVLIVLSTGIGALITPPLGAAFASPEHAANADGKHMLELVSGIIAITGILLAAALYLGKRSFVTKLSESAIGRFFSCWWLNGWGFDWVYDKLFVKPYLFITTVLVKDPFDKAIGFLPLLVRGGNKLMTLTETGRLRWYALSLVGGAIVLIAIMLITFMSSVA